MEQIEKKDGFYYYNGERLSSAEMVYECFRRDYHKSLGKLASKRLNRIGSRKERIHEYGFVFDRQPDFSNIRPVKVGTYLMGISATSYCRAISGRDIPSGTDEEIERWIDWVFSADTKATRLIGKKQKMGRTSKILKTKFR